MQSKLLHDDKGKRTFAVILKTGDEVMGSLQEFAAKERIGGAQVTAIGALSGAKLAYFDWEAKQYRPIPVAEQVEVASLVGDIAVGPDQKPSVHVHAVLACRSSAPRRGCVRPIARNIVTESPAHPRKAKDAESGLALIQLR
jgi:predicted DNA-binding protein with PD1-like motif